MLDYAVWCSRNGISPKGAKSDDLFAIYMECINQKTTVLDGAYLYWCADNGIEGDSVYDSITWWKWWLNCSDEELDAWCKSHDIDKNTFKVYELFYAWSHYIKTCKSRHYMSYLNLAAPDSFDSIDSNLLSLKHVNALYHNIVNGQTYNVPTWLVEHCKHVGSSEAPKQFVPRYSTMEEELHKRQLPTDTRLLRRVLTMNINNRAVVRTRLEASNVYNYIRYYRQYARFVLAFRKTINAEDYAGHPIHKAKLKFEQVLRELVHEHLVPYHVNADMELDSLLRNYSGKMPRLRQIHFFESERLPIYFEISEEERDVLQDILDYTASICAVYDLMVIPKDCVAKCLIDKKRRVDAWAKNPDWNHPVLEDLLR